MFSTLDKIRESNRIEGITREPTDAEIAEFLRFLELDEVTVQELERFVSIYQPGARLRAWPNMDVRVGSHIAPAGGPVVLESLHRLLAMVNVGEIKPWPAHIEYETLHPFMDGNGRSGRMLWYWMMYDRGNKQADLGFLHSFYYQTLSNVT